MSVCAFSKSSAAYSADSQNILPQQMRVYLFPKYKGVLNSVVKFWAAHFIVESAG